MRILIDGDGCPVISQSIKIAKKHNIKLVILCDTSHNFDKYDVEIITISKGNDAVDFEIVNKANNKDIVVTQDYGLATMLLSKGCIIINQNGLRYTNDNIDMLLFTRYISKKMRDTKTKVKGPKKRTKQDNENFEKSLENIIKHIREK